MMRALLISFLAVLAAAVVAPAAAHAACTLSIGGIDYVDTDCDMVRDVDDMSNPVDNCPEHPNGDCDQDPLNCDVDGDGQASDAEIAAGDQVDWNHNDIGDACEDADADAIVDYLDNCRAEANPDQDPLDCTDTDLDGIEDGADNCVEIWNPSQLNSDSDSLGDACDICRYVANQDQDPSVCPNDLPGSNPSEVAEPNPNPGITIGEVPEHVEGSGGCAMVGGGGLAPLAAMLILASLAAIVGIRKR